MNSCFGKKNTPYSWNCDRTSCCTDNWIMRFTPPSLRRHKVSYGALWSLRTLFNRVCSHDVTAAMLEEWNILLGIELYFYANYSFCFIICKYGFWSHERTHSIVWLGSLEVNASVLIGSFFLDPITNPIYTVAPLTSKITWPAFLVLWNVTNRKHLAVSRFIWLKPLVHFL